MPQEVRVIRHGNDDCIGNWRIAGQGSSRQLECDHCKVRLPYSPENRLAAIDENYAGIYLRRLTGEGRTRIADEDKEKT